MKKKLLIYFAFIIGLLLWGGSVYAQVLPAPDTIDVVDFSYGQSIPHTYQPQTLGWYGISGYGVDIITAQDSRVNFNYSNLCPGSEISFNFTALAYYEPYNFFINQTNGFKYYNNSVEYSCVVSGSQYNGNVIDYKCYGIGVSGWSTLTIPSIAISSNLSYGIAISTSSTYSCDSTNADILNNQNINTQNIINNNNNNTQSIINNQNQNVGAVINNDNQNTQAIISSITDDTPQTESESDSTLNRWKNLIPTNGVVSSLFLIPVNLLDKLVAGFNGTCQTFNLGNLMGTDLILPCIQPANFFGSTLWGIIDLACCGMMLFSMFKKFVKVFSDITNLRDTPMNELYGGGR